MHGIFKSLIGISVLILTLSCQDKTINKEGWTIYTTDSLEYSVQYPSNWEAINGKDFFITGPNRGYSTMAWRINTTSPQDLQTIDSLFKEQYTFDNPHFSKEAIRINGINGFRYYNIKSEGHIGYTECMILKTNSKWYKFCNIADRSSDFDSFYKSFILKI